jgi:methyl-accepting chemotaxis protein
MTNESEGITSGTQTQADSVGRLHHDAEALSYAAIQMSEEVANARDRARRMNHAAHQSEEVFQSLVGGMHQLTVLNTEAMDVVVQLSEYASEIGTISNVVVEIADQTHLLALNVSIEAASAGEEGRGFTVVAQAVKSLADESAVSAKTIRGLIHQIQGEVTRAVGHIRAQVKVSEREAKKGVEFANTFHVVNQEAEQVVGIVEAMVDGLTLQAQQATEQLNEARHIAQVAEQIRLGARKYSRPRRSRPLSCRKYPRRLTRYVLNQQSFEAMQTFSNPDHPCSTIAYFLTLY